MLSLSSSQRTRPNVDAFNQIIFAWTGCHLPGEAITSEESVHVTLHQSLLSHFLVHRMTPVENQDFDTSHPKFSLEVIVPF